MTVHVQGRVRCFRISDVTLVSASAAFSSEHHYDIPLVCAEPSSCDTQRLYDRSYANLIVNKLSVDYQPGKVTMPDTNANTVKSFKQRKSFGETASVVYLSATISRSTSPTSFVRYSPFCRFLLCKPASLAVLYVYIL